MRKLKKQYLILPVLLIILYASFYIRVPYLYSMPGDAIELAPIVKVEDGNKEKAGSFMMVTVAMGRANLWQYMYSFINPYMNLTPEESYLHPGEDLEQYFKRQQYIMKSSQEDAMMVAFKKAGVEYEVKNEGAVVTHFIKGMPAEKLLKVGDIITQVDEIPIKTKDDLINSLKGRKFGEQVTLKVQRDGKPISIDVQIAQFPNTFQTDQNQSKAGIGIYNPVTHRTIVSSKKVEFDTEKIGGPSAGMMFTLEIINQLLPEDLAKGYRIAGTGEIRENGSIGPIGGVEHKVVAASKKGADIFFAPEDDSNRSNYEVALESARKFNLDIKVIPVRNIDDALSYLKSLPEKREKVAPNS